MDAQVLERPSTAVAATHEPALVLAMQQEAEDVVSVALRPFNGSVQPFSPGAHVEVQLPGGWRRAYSLVNAPGERGTYRIAVHRSPGSRGGSRYVHDMLRVGQVVQVGRPRNDFPLAEGRAPVVLIAGGIGITPLWAMVQALSREQRPWVLHYAARQPGRAAFLEPLLALGGEQVRTYFDSDGSTLNLGEVVAQAPADAHLYCCGPSGMLQAFCDATAALDPARVHLERFGAKPVDRPVSATAAFEVVLARSGRTLQVPACGSVLDAVQAAGVGAPFSCREGFCGTCETRVLEGVPDHRDTVLSQTERSAGRTMMICCSRSKTDRLVLDL